MAAAAVVAAADAPSIAATTTVTAAVDVAVAPMANAPTASAAAPAAPAAAAAAAAGAAVAAGTPSASPPPPAPHVVSADALDDGAAVVHLLTPAEQQHLYAQCHTLYETHGPVAHHGTVAQLMAKPRHAHRGRYLLCFENANDVIPAPMQHWAARAMRVAAAVAPELPGGARGDPFNDPPTPVPVALASAPAVQHAAVVAATAVAPAAAVTAPAAAAATDSVVAKPAAAAATATAVAPSACSTAASGTADPSAAAAGAVAALASASASSSSASSMSCAAHADGASASASTSASASACVPVSAPVYVPTRINVVLYPVGSSLGTHADNHDGWVVLLSLGCDVVFRLRVCRDDATNRVHAEKRVVLRSGDALVFNGDSRWRVLHSVDAVVPGTCPSFLPAPLTHGRISVQLRGLCHTVPAAANSAGRAR